MLESGCDECDRPTFNCAPNDSWVSQNMGVNQLTYKLVQVEGDTSFLPTTEDELIEVERLLAEPQTEKNLDGDVMYVGSEGTLGIDDFPCFIDYNSQEVDYGILNAVAQQAGKQDSKYEFVDNMLQGVNEEENLHFTCNLSNAYTDYLLERNTQLDCGSHNGSSTQILGSEWQTYTIQRDLDFDFDEMPDLSNCVDLMLESTPNQNPLFLDGMNIHELQDVFRSMFGRDTCVGDKQWLLRRILFGLQNFSEIGNISSLVESGLSSIENEVSMTLLPENDLSENMSSSCTKILDNRTLVVDQDGVEDGHAVEDVLPATSEVDRVVGLLEEQESTLITSKRLRKPTRRYIEETSKMDSRCSSEGVKPHYNSSKDKLLHVKKNSQHNRKRSTTMLVESGIQMPCGLRSRRGCPRKDTTLTGNDSGGSKEYVQCTVAPRRDIASRFLESDSQDDSSDDSDTATKNERSGIRKQHNKQWMVSEVIELIEGVSQFGVGRWTEIKKRLFSASAHRTAVDLKDKWRNLLRASGANLHGRKKVKPQQNMIFPIPQIALQRVRELSIIHPYPRERKGKPPSMTTSRAITGSSSSTSGSHRSRTEHAQNLT